MINDNYLGMTEVDQIYYQIYGDKDPSELNKTNTSASRGSSSGRSGSGYTGDSKRNATSTNTKPLTTDEKLTLATQKSETQQAQLSKSLITIAAGAVALLLIRFLTK
jgi:hypothetical protein